MSDRTMLAIGRNAISVPKITKRLLQAVGGVVLTALVSLFVIVLNNVLTARGGGWISGVEAWTAFIKRPDIVGTMLLTAVVTVAFVYWQRETPRK